MHGLHDILERIVAQVEHELAGLDLGKVKHRVYQAEQMLAVALDPFEHSRHLLGRCAVDAVGDQLSVAEDGVERGLVGDAFGMRAPLFRRLQPIVDFSINIVARLPTVVL
jgi:hypothetical protein